MGTSEIYRAVLSLDEITDARWVTREELPALVAEGNVILPPPGSIARWLLDDWMNP